MYVLRTHARSAGSNGARVDAAWLPEHGASG
jgi:hypothetical protein